MSNENKYWDDLVSGLHSQDEGSTAKTSEEKLRKYGSTYKWAVEVKSQLKKVFVWDIFDKKEAKLRLGYRLNKNEQQIIWLSRKVWARAAAILIAILSGALLHSLIPGPFKETRYTEIAVPLGQMTQIRLADGSNVWLNSGSVFKYSTGFGGSSREVFLDGEAFIEVAKDKHRPFIVHAKNFLTEVLGTSFNVSAYSTDNRACLTLVEGSVLLRSQDKDWTQTLKPGQVATMAEGKKPEISSTNTDFYTSWKEGKIVFRRQTLEEIAKKLERWYNVEIRFKDEALKGLVFSGTFLKYKPVDQVFRSLSILNDNIDFEYDAKADQKNIIYIIKKGTSD